MFQQRADLQSRNPIQYYQVETGEDDYFRPGEEIFIAASSDEEALLKLRRNILTRHRDYLGNPVDIIEWLYEYFIEDAEVLEGLSIDQLIDRSVENMFDDEGLHLERLGTTFSPEYQVQFI